MRRWAFRPTPLLHRIETRNGGLLCPAEALHLVFQRDGGLLDHPRPSVASFNAMVGFQTYPAPLLR